MSPEQRKTADEIAAALEALGEPIPARLRLHSYIDDSAIYSTRAESTLVLDLRDLVDAEDLFERLRVHLRYMYRSIRDAADRRIQELG